MHRVSPTPRPPVLNPKACPPLALLQSFLKNSFFNSIHVTHLKCAIQWSFVDAQICATITSQFTPFSPPREETLPVPQSPHPPSSPPPPAITSLLSVSVDLPVLSTSYEWNQTTCGRWCLALTCSMWFKVYLCCSVGLRFISPMAVIPQWVRGPRFVFPLILCWTLVLFPLWCSCE